MNGGVPLSKIRQLYITVAIPKFTYAADIWYTATRISPNSSRGTGSMAVTRRLISAQRRAVLSIIGAMSTSARDITEVHANLLPIPLLLDKIQFHAASRLATLPSSHPLYPIIRRANRHYVRHHRAPIHHLLHRSGIPALLPLETISPMRRRPNFTPDLTVDIPPDKHSAIAQAKLY